MTFQMDDRFRYRMPVTFGPSPGPRQGADGGRFESGDATKTTSFATFATDAALLEALLPPGFALTAATVTFELTRYRRLAWLAGRGYSTLGVKIPCRFDGSEDRVAGPFLLVLWENMADPIITGREELGFAKLYCDLPEDREYDDRIVSEARWDGHGFFAMELSGLADTPAPPPGTADGLLHWRYMPKVGTVGAADSMHAALTPFGRAPVITERYQTATARAAFVRSTFEQLPTLHHVVNRLAELPLHDCIGAAMLHQRGGTDLSEQRVLR
jgi:hypothetical protein